ncbi:hypothetical protein, partial [Streptomyces kaempferi]
MAERELVRAVNETRDGRDFIPADEVLPVHEDVLQDLGDYYQQLSPEEQARLVTERIEIDRRVEAERAPAEAALRSKHVELAREAFRLLQGTGYDFTARDIDRAHKSLTGRSAEYSQLSLQGQAARIVRSLLNSQKRLETATNDALREWGRPLAGGDIHRIHKNLVEKLGREFRRKSATERGRMVAGWAVMERQLIREINSLRGGGSYQDSRILSVHEILLREYESFSQLPGKQRARLVAEYIEDERAEVVGKAAAGRPVPEAVRFGSDSASGVSQEAGPAGVELSVLVDEVRGQVRGRGQAEVSAA